MSKLNITLAIALIIFSLTAVGGDKVPFIIHNNTPFTLALSDVYDTECMYNTSGLSGVTIQPFDTFTYTDLEENRGFGSCMSSDAKFMVDLTLKADTSLVMGAIRYARNGTTGGDICTKFSLVNPVKDYSFWISQVGDEDENCGLTTVGYSFPVTVKNYIAENVEMKSMTPAELKEYSAIPGPLIGASSGGNPETNQFTFEPKQADGSSLAVIEYRPSSSEDNYCTFTYGYQSGKCYADGKSVNNGDDYLACEASSTADPIGACVATLNIKKGMAPVTIAPPQVIGVNVDNEVYTDLKRGTFSPTDLSSYVDSTPPPSTINIGSDLKPAFQFNRQAATNQQPTIAYYTDLPEGVATCTVNYGWDESKKDCYANASGSENNIKCSASPDRNTTDGSCTADLSITYANPPTVSVSVQNSATDSSSTLNLKGYQPSSSSDYTDNPPPSTISPSDTGTFTYAVQDDSSTQPYAEYYYSVSKDAYCKFSYNAYGSAGCAATADPVNNDPVYQVTCNKKTSTSNGMCVATFSMNLGPIKPPEQFNVTVNNEIYDDLTSTSADDDTGAPASIANGEASAVYQESASSSGSSIEKTVTYQLKNFTSASCTFTYGWSSSKSCYASGSASSGPPTVDCGKATAKRDGDSCDVSLTVGMPSS